MTTTKWSRIASAIRGRQAAIAEHWYEAVARTGYSPRGADEVRQYFAAVTDQVVTALLAEQEQDDRAAARAAGRAAGTALANLHYLQPAALERTLALLGQELVAGLSPGELAAVHPRLTEVLGAVAAGFFAQGRALILGEQEETRGALLTAQRRAEERLRQEEQLRTREQATRAAAEAERDRLQQILDVLPAAVLIADTEGQFVLSNAAAARIIGGDITGQALPMRDRDVSVAYGLRRPDGTPYPIEDLPLERAVLRGEEMRGAQMLIRNATSARDVPLLVNSAPLHDRAGVLIGAVAVFQDISALQDLEHTRELFLSAISHDLRSPLTSIYGLAQILQRQAAQLDTPQRERMTRSVHTLLHSTTSMTGLLEHLQDVTHMQLGQVLEIERAPTDLVPIVQAVAERYQATVAHQIELQVGAPHLVGSLDAGRIERVVTNLLINALKYSPEGGDVTVRLAREDDATEPYAVLTVQDRGVGIPAMDMPHIFELFHRGSNVTGRFKGTGVGLASAHEIVRQHGGALTVESTEGAGATFTLRLPLEPETA